MSNNDKDFIQDPIIVHVVFQFILHPKMVAIWHYCFDALYFLSIDFTVGP